MTTILVQVKYMQELLKSVCFVFIMIITVIPPNEMFPQFPYHFQVFLHVSPGVSTICFPRFLF